MKKAQKIIIIFLVILVIALIGLGTYFIINMNNKINEKTNEIEELKGKLQENVTLDDEISDNAIVKNNIVVNNVISNNNSITNNVTTNTSSNNIVDNSQPERKSMTLENGNIIYYEALIGKWKPVSAAEPSEEEPMDLNVIFGSSIKYGGYLTLNADGTYTRYIGAYDENYAKGTFSIEGSKIILTNTYGEKLTLEPYIDDAKDSLLHIKEVTDNYVVYYDGGF